MQTAPSASSRKDLIREYKERTTPRGIYAIRCTANNALWIGAARNLEAQQNSTWFQLDLGSHRNASLQSAWKQHGKDAFTYEVLETLPEDTADLVLEDTLKERRAALAGQHAATELR